MTEKYKLIPSTERNGFFDIVALKDFINPHYGLIKKGEVGGIVESELNLSQSGTCWISQGNMAANTSRVENDAYIGDPKGGRKLSSVRLFDSALVKDRAWVLGSLTMCGNSTIKDNAKVNTIGVSSLVDNAVIGDNANIKTNLTVSGNSFIGGDVSYCTFIGGDISYRKKPLVLYNALITKQKHIKHIISDDGSTSTRHTVITYYTTNNKNYNLIRGYSCQTDKTTGLPVSDIVGVTLPIDEPSGEIASWAKVVCDEIKNRKPKYHLEPEGDYYRIVADKSFTSSHLEITKNDKGGLISGEHNLSQNGNCWIDYDSKIDDNAYVSGDALVVDSELKGNAFVTDQAYVESSIMVNLACARDTTRIKNSVLKYNSVVAKNAVADNVLAIGSAFITDNVDVQNLILKQGNIIYGDIQLDGDTDDINEFFKSVDNLKISTLANTTKNDAGQT